MVEDVVQQAPARPAKSVLRASRLLDPIITKPGMVDEQPPLSPATAPHDVYLSSEEDASSSADEYSDFEFDSDSEYSDESLSFGKHQDTARQVSIIFQGKPSLVTVPSRSAPQSPEVYTPSPTDGPRRAPTYPLMASRRGSTSSESAFMSAMEQIPRPSFLNTDPYAARPQSQLSNYDEERTRVLRNGTGSMLKRTFSLARKRSRPQLRLAASDSLDTMSLRSASVEDLVDRDQEKPSVAPRVLRKRSPMMATSPSITPPPAGFAEPRPATRGSTKLREGLTISLGGHRW